MAVDIPEPILERPLAAVRESCARLCAEAQLVRIDRDALRGYAAGIDPRDLAGAWGTQLPDLGRDAELRASFVVALDALNFGSGWFPHLAKLPGHSGYRTIEARVTDWWRGAPPRAPELARIGVLELAARLGQRPEGPVAELLAWFARSLADLGALVERRFAGSFLALLEAAEGSAERLVRILCEMPLYRDWHALDGHTVVLLKRAQITAADAAQALGERLPPWRDLDALTMFADNLVPHVLRLDGVLAFDPELVARIEREELLEAGSREELEIRASGVVAVEEIVAALRERGANVRAMDVDAWLWTRGGEARYKARPRHRARCPYY